MMPFIEATDPYRGVFPDPWWEDLGLGLDEFNGEPVE
jgi:hypothetical protein